uniref:Uncharacterized protein n=1 Tax=Myotis myotis TaxID=51298 RepID=A0A7J7T6R4_MYOMY|nr:hypothetical protein mMyoMyo1_009271 [Myotis myotis]
MVNLCSAENNQLQKNIRKTLKGNATLVASPEPEPDPGPAFTELQEAEEPPAAFEQLTPASNFWDSPTCVGPAMDQKQLQSKMKKHLKRQRLLWCPLQSQSRLQAQPSLNFQMWTHLQLVSNAPQLLWNLWS